METDVAVSSVVTYELLTSHQISSFHSALNFNSYLPSRFVLHLNCPTDRRCVHMCSALTFSNIHSPNLRPLGSPIFIGTLLGFTGLLFFVDISDVVYIVLLGHQLSVKIMIGGFSIIMLPFLLFVREMAYYCGLGVIILPRLGDPFKARFRFRFRLSLRMVKPSFS